MVTIRVETNDQNICYLGNFLLQLGSAMAKHQPLTILISPEGPDIAELGLVDLLRKFSAEYQYPLDQITINSYNVIQPQVAGIKYNLHAPIHFVNNTRTNVQPVSKNINKTFGLFVGRSNTPRLYLSSYLWNRYRSKTIQTFHYDKAVDYHRNNLGVDQLLTQYPMEGIELFLKYSPLKIDDLVSYPILMDQHCKIANIYSNFFVEIACESYFSGTAFFPTEKIWRPIAAKTPFIVQGPQHYIKNLHKLGFKTFSQWWDEGYVEDHAQSHPIEICKIINRLSALDNNQLTAMYHDMQDTVEHNYARLQALTRADFDVFA